MNRRWNQGRSNHERLQEPESGNSTTHSTARHARTGRSPYEEMIRWCQSAGYVIGDRLRRAKLAEAVGDRHAVPTSIMSQ